MVQGVQSGSADNLQLDAEGGPEAKTSKSQYFRSGIAVCLAAATREGEPLNRAQGGAGDSRCFLGERSRLRLQKQLVRAGRC